MLQLFGFPEKKLAKFRTFSAPMYFTTLQVVIKTPNSGTLPSSLLSSSSSSAAAALQLL